MFKRYFFLLLLALLVITPRALADVTDPLYLSGFAWSSNAGWIHFGGTNDQVTIDPATGDLSGYAWSSNIGWIQFSPDLTGPPSVPDAHGARVATSTGIFTGWAKATNGDNTSGWDGWINMTGVTAAPLVNVNGVGISTLSGFAWGSDVVGWVNFNGVSISTSTTPPDCHDDSPPCPDDSNPPTISVTGSDRMEINSQPLASPAISSAAQFDLYVPADSVVKLTIQNPASHWAEVTCRLSTTEYAGDQSQFSPCSSLRTFSHFDTPLYLNVRVDRPVQALNIHNPYQVVVSIDGCSGELTCSAGATFSYNVGTVKPI